MELKTEARQQKHKFCRLEELLEEGGGLKTEQRGRKSSFHWKWCESLLEETRLFALAFTGKCRAKQSGVKAARRARPAAAGGQEDLPQMCSKSPAGAEMLALNVLLLCGREALASALAFKEC